MASIEGETFQDAAPVASSFDSELFGDDASAPPGAAQGPSPSIAPEDATESSAAQNIVAGEASAPITESGMSAVAQFLPDNATLNHVTPGTSQSLTNDLAPVQGDASTTDNPDTLGSAPDVPLVHEDVQHVTNGSGSPFPPFVQEPTTPPHLADEVAATSTPLAVNGTIDVPPSVSEPLADPSQNNGATSAIPTTEGAADQRMSDVAPDALAAGTVRPREDDEAVDERAAKRSKVDKPDGAQAEFKRPEMPTAAPLAPVAAPAASAVANGARPHLPAAPSFSTSALTTVQKNNLLDKLKNTKKIKTAVAFLRPVDYMALGIPQYPNIITRPMDLSTMEQKLKNDEYTSIDHFVSDFELMVNNCFTFNGPSHAISASAQSLRAYFLKQVETVQSIGPSAPRPVKKEAPVANRPVASHSRRESKAPVPATRSPGPAGDTFALLPNGTPQIRRDSTAGRPKRAVVPPAPRDLPYSATKPKRKDAQVGLKFAEHVLDELRKPKHDKYSFIFLSPVDPVALNIPTYHSIIKQPMDMQTITNKLKNGQYSSADEVKADFDLMLNNCFRFNPPDNPVHLTGKEMQREFESLWKRKDGWIKKNQPRSQHVSSASEGESDADDSDEDEEDAGIDSNEATIALLRQQLESMQNMVASISAAKRASPKAGSKKKSKSGSSKTKKSGSVALPPARSAPKSKPKKQRLVSYEEKQEISNATESMTPSQVDKLTQIITENVSKYKDMSGEDVELEIDDLPNDVQNKLLRYVRSIFPRQRASPEEEMNVDDDYEPEQTARGAGAKKKHKPMKKHEQESRIQQLRQTMEQMKGGISVASNSYSAQAAESSSDEDSESSEEE